MIVYLLIGTSDSNVTKSNLHKRGIAVTSEELAIIWKNEDPEHRNCKKVLVIDAATEEELEMYLRR